MSDNNKLDSKKESPIKVKEEEKKVSSPSNQNKTKSQGDTKVRNQDKDSKSGFNELPNLLKPLEKQESKILKAQVAKEKICNCRSSRCIKLYCECFISGELCANLCNCSNCYNKSDNEVRKNAITNILKRDPLAFNSKVVQKSEKFVAKKGCNCNKSNCQKKYCECFNQGIDCTTYCHCRGCLNGKPLRHK